MTGQLLGAVSPEHARQGDPAHVQLERHRLRRPRSAIGGHLARWARAVCRGRSPSTQQGRRRHPGDQHAVEEPVDFRRSRARETRCPRASRGPRQSASRGIESRLCPRLTAGPLYVGAGVQLRIMNLEEKKPVLSDFDLPAAYFVRAFTRPIDEFGLRRSSITSRILGGVGGRQGNYIADLALSHDGKMLYLAFQTGTAGGGRGHPAWRCDQHQRQSLQGRVAERARPPDESCRLPEDGRRHDADGHDRFGRNRPRRRTIRDRRRGTTTGTSTSSTAAIRASSEWAWTACSEPWSITLS